jgi:rhodanese-related sulfurtransferase
MLERRMAGGEAVTLLDVRGPDEFHGALGHIPGSQNIPLAELPARLGELRHPQERPIVIVCRTDVRSARAAALLRAAGFRQVEVLRGGVTGWNSRIRSTEKGHGKDAVHP